MNKALAEFVRGVRLEKKLSITDVQHKSGGAISDSYISRIENGQINNVSPEKLDALAKGLGVHPDDVYNVARGLKPIKAQESREILAETFDGKELTEQDWQEIEAVLKTMIGQKRELRSKE